MIAGQVLLAALLVGRSVVSVKVNGYTIEPGANLAEANLRGANLTRELLSSPRRGEHHLGADKLEGPNFERAFADEATRWPEGFDPKAAGVIIQQGVLAALRVG